MILSGSEIRYAAKRGDIVITPFSESRLNPNSYNLRLADDIIMYNNNILDMREDNPYRVCKIPEEGFLLHPNRLYLCRTLEYTKTTKYVPMIEGRSSIGRLGLYIHVTAGFGDIGFEGYWTLELSCVQPVVIYPNIEICQIFYHTIQGVVDKFYDEKGKYNKNQGVQTSMLYKDFNMTEDGEKEI